MCFNSKPLTNSQLFVELGKYRGLVFFYLKFVLKAATDISQVFIVTL